MIWWSLGIGYLGLLGLAALWAIVERARSAISQRLSIPTAPQAVADRERLAATGDSSELADSPDAPTRSRSTRPRVPPTPIRAHTMTK